MVFDLKWLAGLFDGEGHVSLTYTPNGLIGKQRVFRLQVGISQKNLPFLKQLKRAFGGSIHFNNSNCFQITWQGPQAEAFLTRIRSYVILKHKVVELAFKYRALVSHSYRMGPGTGSGNHQPASLIKRKLAIRNKIMHLNKVS